MSTKFKNLPNGIITLAVSGTRTGTGTSTRTMGTINVSPVPVQVQCERSYIKPYNPFIHVSVPVPVPVLETPSVIKTISAVSTTKQTFLVTTHPPPSPRQKLYFSICYQENISWCPFYFKRKEIN